MAKEEEQKWQDLLAARAKMTAAPVVFASDPVAQGYRAVPLDDTEVETPVVQSPGVQKPSTDPSTWGVVDMTTVKPQTTTATPTGYILPTIGPEPKRSDYDYYTQDFSQYFETPLTPEERARRERVAYISSGVANLGNAIGALGNMFYARGGAPAQTLPTVPDVDQKVSAFRQHADNVRDDYINGIYAQRKLGEDAYNKAYSNYLERIKLHNAAVGTQENYEIKRMKQQLDARKAELQADLVAAKVRGENAKAEKLETELQYIKAIEEGKVAAWEGLAYMRNTAGQRNEAMRDKHIYETGPQHKIERKYNTVTGQWEEKEVETYRGSRDSGSNSGVGNGGKKKSLPNTSNSSNTSGKKKLPNT